MSVEIKAFQPQEYWEISVDSENGQKRPIRLDVVQFQGKKFEPKNIEQARSAVDFLQISDYFVKDLEINQQRQNQKHLLLLQLYSKSASTKIRFWRKNDDVSTTFI